MQMDSLRVPVRAFAYAMIAAPLLFLVSDLLTSGIWEDDQAAFLANVAANESRHYIGGLVGVLGAVCLFVAVAGIALLVSTKRRRLGMIAGGMALFGVMFMPGAWLMGTAFENVAATDPARTALAAFFERSEDSAALGVAWIVPFSLLGIGTIALAVGLFIGRVVPRWIPVALMLGIVATFVADGGVSGYVASALMIIALGGIGFTLLRGSGEAPASPQPPEMAAPAAT
jgi:hypothetical protein